MGQDLFPDTAAGSVATDPIWDAPGDLAVGTGPDTAARLAKGTALQVLRMNAGATAQEWANAADAPIAWTVGSAAMSSYGANATLGNGTLTHRYRQIGKTVHVEFHIVCGTTTTWGTGGGLINNLLPVAPFAGFARLRLPFGSASASFYTQLHLVHTSATQAEAYNAGGNGLTGAPGANVQYFVYFSYEAA